MSFQTDKIYTQFAGNKFLLLPRPSGWSYYPITYRGKQYVVDAEIKPASTYVTPDLPDWNIQIRIYEYGEEKKLFKKHRRAKVFQETVNFLTPEGDKLLDLRKVTKEEWKIHLPRLMEHVFHAYEQKLALQKQVAEAETWNGVVGQSNNCDK